MTTLDEFLEHYGTKGMKWGVRKDRGHEGQRAKTKKIEKLDRKFIRDSQSVSTTWKVHNYAADKMNNEHLPRLNKKYEGNDFLRDSPTRRRYYKEVQESYLDSLQEGANALGVSASGKLKYAILDKGDGAWDIVTTEIEHSIRLDEEVVASVQAIFDASGYITSISMDELQQDSFDVDGFLEHYGVRGMKWGVRKKRNTSSDHDESRALLSRHKSELSNAELKRVNERLNLETNLNRLNPNTVARGRATAAALVGTIGIGITAYNYLNSPAGKAVVSAGKKALAKALA